MAKRKKTVGDKIMHKKIKNWAARTPLKTRGWTQILQYYVLIPCVIWQFTKKKPHQYEQQVLCVYIFLLVSVMVIFSYSLRNIGVTNAVISPLMTYHHVCNKSNTTGATRGTGTVYPSRAPGFTRMNLDP